MRRLASHYRPRCASRRPTSHGLTDRPSLSAQPTARSSSGIQWSSGTISNHLFTGYPVRAVLLDLGVPERAPSAAGSGGTGEGWHVHFESGVGPEDPEGGKAWYGCSLPYEAVMCVSLYLSSCCLSRFFTSG